MKYNGYNIVPEEESSMEKREKYGETRQKGERTTTRPGCGG